LAESFALHFSGRAAARLDEPPLLTRAFFVNNEIYMAFLLNSQAQGVFGKNQQSTQTPWRGAQYSCIGLRPALIKLW